MSAGPGKIGDAGSPDVSLPDGISARHFADSRSFKRHASLVSLLALGGILALTFTGLLGGEMQVSRTASTDAADLTFVGPRFIRNGMFFEAHVLIDAKHPIDKLVVAIDHSLISDMTMNSMVPAAADESTEGGALRFEYAQLDAGDHFDVKLDFQINPSLVLGTDGKVAVYDDEKRLAEVPVTITVLP